jgi:sugar transferase (PEP-CTERM/EpsH1 system associated)
VNILFLTSRLPFPPIGGDRLRTFNFVRHLKKRHTVTIASFVENARDVQGLDEYAPYYDKLITVPLPKVKSHLNCLFGLFTRTPLQVHYYASSRMREAIRKELASGQYDVIVCHLVRMAQYLPPNGSVRKVIDFTDAISLYHRRSAAFRRGLSWPSIVNTIEANRVLPCEQEAMHNADLSLFISRIDADFLESTSGGARTAIVANGVDLDHFSYQGDGYDPNHIVFLGNMRTFPNTDAVRYFAHSVFPLIRQSRPDAVFTIVGNQPSRDVRELHDGKHIIVTGRVESVVPYLRDAAVTVAPMRACTGVQNKILEALAAGTPVVTTTMGAEGLDPAHLVIADTAREFARATLDLMADAGRRRELSRAGRAWVEAHSTWDAALTELDAALDQILQNASPRPLN